MATDWQYFDRLNEIQQLKAYIRHLESRLIYGHETEQRIRYERSLCLSPELAKAIDHD